MAADWRDYRMAQSEDGAEEGEQILPTDMAEAGESGEFLATYLSEDELQRMAEERKMVTEDFPDQ
jgi:hypothetical protein